MIRKKLLFIAIPSTIVAAAIILSFRAHGVSDLAEARLFNKAITAIERNYVDPHRIEPRKMLDGALNQMQRQIPEILVKDADSNQLSVIVGLAERRFRKGSLQTLSDLGRLTHEILPFIAENYHGETPPVEIEYAAIDGMLEELDPHSNFLPPKVYNEFQVGTRGKFGGLGIVISIKDGMLTVIAPIDGTPAAHAGIKAGDHILQIDDESTINMSLTDAVNKLRGDVGTKVMIVVERQGQAERKITLTRATINIDSVQHRLLAEGGKRIGYIKVKNFQANTDDDVRAALKDFHADGQTLDGLILDVRNNPGGLLNSSVDLADHFLSEGTIVSTVGPRDQVMEKECAHAQGTQEAYPIIVLINEGSASASEIVAGALQANDRAVVVGKRSFGKGSVQTIFELEGGSALKLTIAQYKPGGTQTIQLAGVTPDVDLLPVTVDRKSMNLIEDVLPSEVELERHLENEHRAKEEVLGRSQYKLRYLKPFEDEKEEEKSAREYQKGPDVEKDYAVVLARRLLAQAGSASRKEMLGRIASPIKEAEREQEQAINGALKLVGIDWMRPEPKGEPRLTLAYQLKSGKAGIKRAKAGEKVEIILQATNTGTGAYSRLIAVGQSDMPFLANREFPFGFIPPGATRTWSAPIELPEGLPKQDIIMDVSFEEANGHLPEPLTVVIPVDELPQPSFAFSLSMPSQMKGKSMATGAPVSLDVDVTNTGGGTTSKETAATISNECGEKLFIEKGREKLGAMPPKATRRAPFRFHLSPEFDKSTCELKLTIADVKRFVVLTKKIDLLVSEGKISPPVGTRYGPPMIEVARAPTSTADTSAEISGTIRDTDPIRDYFLFVGEKKIAYVPNPKETSEMPFSATVPLEPGNNQITIGARDELDLMGRKIVVIDRTSGERKKKKPREAAFGQEMEP